MNGTQPKTTRTRRYVRILGVVVLVAMVVVGPNLVFYTKWLWPFHAIPTGSTDQIDQWASEQVNESLSTAFRDALVASRVEVEAPSMSAAVGFDGELKWAGAIGYADIESGKLATISSRYRLGSTSKTLTGVLLARLIDAKQVELDTPIGKYVAGLPEHIQPLTARMLASHTAGVRHYSRFPTYWLGWHESYSSKAYADVADGLEMFIHDDLRFEPGTNFAYSTFGYSLLSRLLEGAAGKDFATLLSTRLFEPAQMTNTSVDLPGEMPERVSFYTTASGRYAAVYPTNASYKLAGGGIVATPSDLVRLGMALMGDSFISDKTKDIMWTPVKLPDGSTNPENYGLGWRIDTAKGFPDTQSETLVYHHGGVQEGGVCFFVIAPAYGISAAAVANTSEAATRTQVQNLAVELIRLATKRRP